MEEHDGAWHDRMYNNRALVPEHAKHFEHWANASRQARKDNECVLDVPYGDSPGERLDVFPAPRALAQTVVFIHGGYWRSLDKSDHSFVAAPFQEAGACVMVPNYDLCPAVTIPQIALQIARAVAWAWKHAPDYGGDPRQLTVMGHSAGVRRSESCRKGVRWIGCRSCRPDSVRPFMAMPAGRSRSNFCQSQVSIMAARCPPAEWPITVSWRGSPP